jgi:hypothetical protein
MSRFHDIVYGAIAGLNGAAGMSVLRLAARRANLVDVMPPQILRESVSGREIPRAAAHVSDHALHVVIGLLGGAVFGALGRRSSRGLIPGALFGTGLWAISLLSFVPSLGVRHAQAQATGRQTAVNFVAHLLYGIVLPLTIREMAELDRRRDWQADRETRRVG